MNKDGINSARFQDSSLNPGLDFAALQTDTIRHESAADDSHYKNHKDGWNEEMGNGQGGRPAGENLATYLERLVYPSEAELNTAVTSACEGFDNAVKANATAIGEPEGILPRGASFPQLVQLSTAGMPTGTVNVQYTHQFTKQAGTGFNGAPAAVTRVWSLVGAAPPDVTWSINTGNGMFTATATAAGTYNVTVKLKESVTGAIAVDDESPETYSWTVSEPEP